ncbi:MULTISPECIES: LiaF domain-containing protein [Sphingobacterium]|jgi:predicted membrane protein|uniref:LiaF transmembrane domain-containing protein n=1 Tax=Sphingobacterium TaxID=28453 RepID=UPI000C0BD648|nr:MULTISPECIES: LiaF domain-containing protein [Sphingobacterium]MCT1530335.1 cell wall-active antibiotics response protein [Sphingobacterium daejeonense]
MDNQTTKTDYGKPPKNNKSSNLVGFIIIFLGVAILFKNLNMGNIVPNWMFGWETILIIIGLVIGINSKFEKKSSIVLIIIGSVFLLKNELDIHLGRFLIPAAAIALGFYLINRNKSTPTLPPTTPPKDEYDWDKRVTEDYQNNNGGQSPTGTQNPNDSYAQTDSVHRNYGKNFMPDFENYLKVDNYFSDTKKVILTKNFLGGNITSVFGSTQLNFLQADLKQPVVIDTFQLFGSTKIIVPTNWKVYSNISSIFGEVDDRRPMIEVVTDENKKIYITGTSLFGGLTIKNS